MNYRACAAVAAVAGVIVSAGCASVGAPTSEASEPMPTRSAPPLPPPTSFVSVGTPSGTLTDTCDDALGDYPNPEGNDLKSVRVDRSHLNVYIDFEFDGPLSTQEQRVPPNSVDGNPHDDADGQYKSRFRLGDSHFVVHMNPSGQRLAMWLEKVDGPSDVGGQTSRRVEDAIISLDPPVVSVVLGASYLRENEFGAAPVPWSAAFEGDQCPASGTLLTGILNLEE